ncbi:MAG: hypothetical protein ACMX3H_10435 [Sodalis sp. (in: enterobacteria)]|uniref:hypothetical protein n=1 Tax=Sodalis sp. (in: enterobacteria) TaxID=1898979 RepID=UPI0039E4E9B6
MLIKNISNSSNAEKKSHWREIFDTEAFTKIMSQIPAMSIYLAAKGKSRDEIKNAALIAIRAAADIYKEIYSGGNASSGT